MFAVIRIRGKADTPGVIEDTLKMLRLENVNNCVILAENDSFKGMIKKVKDYVTYGEIKKEVLIELLKKRLRMMGDKRVNDLELKKITKLNSFDELSEKIINGEARLKDFDQLQQHFRLTPPSKGFVSVKEHYPKGDLGYRGDKINEILERMI